MKIYRIQGDDCPIPPRAVYNGISTYYIAQKDLSIFLDYCAEMKIKIINVSIMDQDKYNEIKKQEEGEA